MAAPAITLSLTKVKMPHLIILSSAALYVYLGPGSSIFENVDRELATVDDEFASLPAVVPVAPLRGGSGAPTAFKWISHGPGQAVAGTPFKATLRALDARGRSARGPACDSLRVNVSVNGKAQLKRSASQISWQGSELEVVVENTAAELVVLEVQIRMPQSEVAITRSMHIDFTAAPVHVVELQARPAGALSGVPCHFQGNTGGTWPTHVVFEVALSARDQFGNKVVLGSVNATKGSVDPRPVLRSSSDTLDIMTRNGQFDLEKLEPFILLRGSEIGNVEVWLDNLGSLVSLPASLHIKFVEYMPPLSIQGTQNQMSKDDLEWDPLATEVRDAFLHAWNGYRRYAWGKDELEPLSQKGRDTFGNIGMIVLDSLTTLWLMGLHKEFERAATFVDNDLDFDTADREVSVFELNIRALGGLLGAHALSGKKIFLQRATELGERMLPALESPSGLPWPRWNIARQGRSATDEPTILAEAGSLQLEFRYLTALTGDPRYKRAVDINFDSIQATNLTGLMPVHLTNPSYSPPQAFQDTISLGALADSYYEYLLKQWLQSPQEPRFKDLWLQVMDELPSLVYPKPESLQKQAKVPNYKLVEASGQGKPIWKMDHLSCFTPGMIALGLRSLPAKDLQSNNRNATLWPLAQGLTASCAEFWTSTKSGLAPEYNRVNPKTFELAGSPPQVSHSFLRPETAESLFYLFRVTGDPKWRRLGKQIFHAIIKNAKVDGGFASVKDVHQVPTEKMDEMQSFVMAETFKYLYLLFSPADALDLDKFVLNTEGHPLRVLGPW